MRDGKTDDAAAESGIAATGAGASGAGRRERYSSDKAASVAKMLNSAGATVSDRDMARLRAQLGITSPARKRVCGGGAGGGGGGGGSE